MYPFILLVLVASVSASAIFETQCPEVKPVDDFKYNIYGQGVWYEVARYPNSKEKNVSCGSVEFKMEGDVIKEKVTFVSNNKLKFFEGTSKLASDAGTTGKLSHSMPQRAGVVVDHDLYILAIDYDQYFISYHCHYNEAKKTRQDLAWIMSRSKTLSPESKAAVDKFLKDSTILNASTFVWSSLSENDCRVDA